MSFKDFRACIRSRLAPRFISLAQASSSLARSVTSLVWLCLVLRALVSSFTSPSNHWVLICSSAKRTTNGHHYDHRLLCVMNYRKAIPFFYRLAWYQRAWPSLSSSTKSQRHHSFLFRQLLFGAQLHQSKNRGYRGFLHGASA